MLAAGVYIPSHNEHLFYHVQADFNTSSHLKFNNNGAYLIVSGTICVYTVVLASVYSGFG